jgi:uncharacterized protein YqfA (UPF0365 family)
MTDLSLYIIIMTLIVLLVFISTVPLRLWHTARRAGIKIKMGSFLGMRLRKIPPKCIVNPLIKASKAGLSLKPLWLENHYLLGGNVDRVVDALITAKQKNIPLEFPRASSFDIAGRDMEEAMEMSINPVVDHMESL